MIKRGRDPPATLKHLYESLHTFFLWDTREDNDKTSSSRALTRNPRISEQHPHAHLLVFDQHHQDTQTLMLTAQACWVRICTLAKKKNSGWRMCSRTKSGPWKLYGEAVSLPSLQLKRDSKTSPLTPEIWAFPPAYLPLHAPVPVPLAYSQAFPRWEHTRVISPKWTPPPQPLLFHLSHPDRLRKEVKT